MMKYLPLGLYSSLVVALSVRQASAFHNPVTISRATTSTCLFGIAEDRRAFLVATVTGATASVLSSTLKVAPARADDASLVNYQEVSADIAELIRKNPDWGPTLVRLAWHSSGTYDKNTQTGGSRGGTIRFSSELA